MLKSIFILLALSSFSFLQAQPDLVKFEVTKSDLSLKEEYYALKLNVLIENKSTDTVFLPIPVKPIYYGELEYNAVSFPSFFKINVLTEGAVCEFIPMTEPLIAHPLLDISDVVRIPPNTTREIIINGEHLEFDNQGLICDLTPKKKINIQLEYLPSPEKMSREYIASYSTDPLPDYLENFYKKLYKNPVKSNPFTLTIPKAK